MFTGIVEELGAIREAGTGRERDNWLSITCSTVLDGTRIGDSIAVNGVCLTVTELGDDFFKVGLSPETLRRTNLGMAQPGDGVNLERALAVGARMGGHYVQGHVDGTGTIINIEPEGESKLMTFSAPQRLMPYIVEKGFIAVDGVSLTVAARSETTFTVALIAHTLAVVNLGRRAVGDTVNLEVDIIAKYVESLLRYK